MLNVTNYRHFFNRIGEIRKFNFSYPPLSGGVDIKELMCSLICTFVVYFLCGYSLIQPNQEETQTKLFHITYNCATDEYTRHLSQSEKTRGFQVFTNKLENVFRKEEHDWKMVYLARTEGSSSAEISWKFDFKGRYVNSLYWWDSCSLLLAHLTRISGIELLILPM